MKLEITPEPSDEERSAIVEALAEERPGGLETTRFAWRRAGIEADSTPQDARDELDSTL